MQLHTGFRSWTGRDLIAMTLEYGQDFQRSADGVQYFRVLKVDFSFCLSVFGECYLINVLHLKYRHL